MSLPEEPVEKAAALKTGYRWQLDRATQTNIWLRPFFSTVLLFYTVFGPGVLLRFPGTSVGIGFEPVSTFYAFRPVLYTLSYVGLVCALAALARRGMRLFEAALAADTSEATTAAERERYVRHVRPSTFIFVLSGNRVVDMLVMLLVLFAYCFWTVLLVETIPPGLRSYAVAGIVLGAYGFFATLIVAAWVWVALERRLRALLTSAR